MSKMELNLGGDENGNPRGPVPQLPPSPIAGYFAVGLGLAGIFTIGPLFVPMAFIASVIALFSGQIIWGIMGMMLTIGGFITSPVLMTLLGLASLAAYFGIPI